jgi:hypothetical protein
MTDTDTFLTIEEASKFCAERGFPYAVSTLNSWRCRGMGPRFVKNGPRRVGYSKKALLNWLGSRMSGEVASTSECRTAA